MISIIIPVYNACQYLAHGFSWVKGFRGDEAELILVDDGSSDGSDMLCDTIARQISNIPVRVIHKSNGGPSSARNVGIDNALGEWITFLDADDDVNNSIADCFRIAVENNNIDLHVFSLRISAGNIDEEISYSIQTYLGAEIGEYLSHQVVDKKYGNGWLCNKIYRKSIIGDLRMDTHIHLMEDELFNQEYLSRCQSVKCYNQYYYTYLIDNPTSIRSRYLSNHWKIINKVYTGFLAVSNHFNMSRGRDMAFQEGLLKRTSDGLFYSIATHAFHKDSHRTDKEQREYLKEISDSEAFAFLKSHKRALPKEIQLYIRLIEHNQFIALRSLSKFMTSLRQIKGMLKTQTIHK